MHCDAITSAFLFSKRTHFSPSKYPAIRNVFDSEYFVATCAGRRFKGKTQILALIPSQTGFELQRSLVSFSSFYPLQSLIIL
ncbi:hypothetical protein K443DRAFT_675936 [Laccaria amethystina LaAM-08-1]|jgi:hypothetical protein|uniref:Uncharacterized protein n=1 Tax=Laccaria amethystina LaAM-08-1 TaxID=1095629 RepID=A0A0C9XHR1_9AGAR|nr:hypothetical protein K443DRAFT_675936 [Laccaria amethystina LaAM-08-1]